MCCGPVLSHFFHQVKQLSKSILLTSIPLKCFVLALGKLLVELLKLQFEPFELSGQGLQNLLLFFSELTAQLVQALLYFQLESIVAVTLGFWLSKLWWKDFWEAVDLLNF